MMTSSVCFSASDVFIFLMILTIITTNNAPNNSHLMLMRSNGLRVKLLRDERKSKFSIKYT